MTRKMPFRSPVDVIMRRKATELFLALDDNYISNAIRSADGLTFSHAYDLGIIFEECKVLKKVDGKNRRIHRLEFTPKGKVAAETIRKIFTILNGD